MAFGEDHEGSADGGLRVMLESHLPAWLPPGCATAIFCFGHCFHRHERVRRLELAVDGHRHRPAAARMPRLDLFEWLHIAQLRDLSERAADPEGRSYRSGFWSTVPIRAPDAPGAIEVEAAVRLASGAELVAPLGRIEIRQAQPPASDDRPPAEETIAVCMATFDPDPALFRAQVDSLRAQSEERWICLISDGGSAPERFEQILEVTAADPRFLVSRSEQRLSPYRNFERALRMAPAEAGLIALCDQDDRWYPEKLAVLRGALGSAQLVYCDQRLVSEDGRVLRNSLWDGRRNEHRNLASVLVANTMPGAAMLFRREVGELALPFPETPGVQYHDHWLALVALASGEVGYVDRPLYDYVQHARAVSGELLDEQTPSAAGGDGRGRRPRGAGSRGWRAAYFLGYVSREVQAQTLLVRCESRLSARKWRALRWFVASQRSPVSFAWLLLRPLRRLIGRGETLGEELGLARGILWRWLVVLATAGSGHPGRRPYDASFPDAPVFEQPRLRRWRAGA